MPPAAERVEDAFPLTLRHVGDAFAQDHAAFGPGASFLELIRARFREGTIVHRAVRDLALYESETARLRALPPLARQDAPLPADDAPLRLSPRLALVSYGADLPGMLDALREGRPAQPRPRRAWLLLLPRGGAVEERHLDDTVGWTLEWFREPETYAEGAELVEERAVVESLWAEGILVPA